VQASAEDGAGDVAPIAPWAFGTGYGMRFDSAGAAGAPNQQSTGHTSALDHPGREADLYLHEWALGNGNSQLGINARLSLRQRPHDDQRWAASRQTAPSVLTQNGRARDDAEGLAVLELTDKPDDTLERCHLVRKPIMAKGTEERSGRKLWDARMPGRRRVSS